MTAAIAWMWPGAVCIEADELHMDPNQDDITDNLQHKEKLEPQIYRETVLFLSQHSEHLCTISKRYKACNKLKRWQDTSQRAKHALVT